MWAALSLAGVKAAKLVYVIVAWQLIYSTLLLIISKMGRRARIALAREVLEREGAVCFECGYCLKSLPDKYTCPECGTSYEKTALQARWLEWMGMKSLA